MHSGFAQKKLNDICFTVKNTKIISQLNYLEFKIQNLFHIYDNYERDYFIWKK